MVTSVAINASFDFFGCTWLPLGQCAFVGAYFRGQGRDVSRLVLVFYWEWSGASIMDCRRM